MQLIEWILKHIADKDLLERLRGPIDTLILTVVQKDKQLAFTLLDYLAHASKLEQGQFKNYIIETITPLAPTLGESVMSPVNQSRQEGRVEGLQQGSHKARQEIALALLARGTDEAVVIEITKIDGQELSSLKQQLLVSSVL